jgi:hypothetical protein
VYEEHIKHLRRQQQQQTKIGGDIDDQSMSYYFDVM